MYLDRADLQKWGFCDKKLSNSMEVFVKLHFPPPDMRIFLPILLDFSTTKTDLFLEAAVIAAIRPAAPAPRIITSY